jgi:hypothetical protein
MGWSFQLDPTHLGGYYGARFWAQAAPVKVAAGS